MLPVMGMPCFVVFEDNEGAVQLLTQNLVRTHVTLTENTSTTGISR